MMQIIKRWRVIYHFEGGTNHEFFMYDDHFSNLLVKLAEYHPKVDPITVTIMEEE